MKRIIFLLIILISQQVSGASTKVIIPDFSSKIKNREVRFYTKYLIQMMKMSIDRLKNIKIIFDRQLKNDYKTIKKSEQHKSTILSKLGKRHGAGIAIDVRVNYSKKEHLIGIRGKILNTSSGAIIKKIAISNFVEHQELLVANFVNQCVVAVKNFQRTDPKSSRFTETAISLKKKRIIKIEGKYLKKITKAKNDRLRKKGLLRDPRKGLKFDMIFYFTRRFAILDSSSSADYLGGALIVNPNDSYIGYGLNFHYLDPFAYVFNPVFELHFFKNSPSRALQIYFAAGPVLYSPTDNSSGLEFTVKTSLGARLNIAFLVLDAYTAFEYHPQFKSSFFTAGLGAGLHF